MSETYEMRWYKSNLSEGETVRHEGEWHSQFLLEGDGGSKQPIWVVYNSKGDPKIRGNWYLLNVAEHDVCGGPFLTHTDAFAFFKDLGEEAKKQKGY